MADFSHPPGFEHVDKSYSVKVITVLSSSSIRSKVKQLLASLGGTPNDQAKPPLIVLTARTKASGKLLSVVEIAKEHLARTGKQYFQYSTLRGQALMLSRPALDSHETGEKGSKSSKIIEGKGEAENDEELDEAFEALEEPSKNSEARVGTLDLQSTIKEVPVLVIYFSMRRVQSLKDIYGEQTNIDDLAHDGNRSL